MKKWGIVGAILFVAAVCIGFFAKFDNAFIVEIAVAAFGLTALVIGAYTDGKTKNVKTWQTITIIVLAVLAGVFGCIGGLAQNIYAELAGATLALLAVIFGIVFAKKAK